MRKLWLLLTKILFQLQFKVLAYREKRKKKKIDHSFRFVYIVFVISHMCCLFISQLYNISNLMQKEQNTGSLIQPIIIEQSELQKLLESEINPSTFNLPDANPIKKRQKLQPHSIFPLQALPKFNYSSDVLEPTVVNQTVNFVQQKLQLQSSLLRQIFKSPLYVYNARAHMNKNSQFGCIRVLYSQSSNYKLGKSCQNFKQAKAEFKIKLQNQQTKYSNNQSTNINKQIDLNQKADVNNQKQQIFFQSRFESGNLCFAIQNNNASQPTYYLICSRDLNTSKCTQWFFFKTLNKLAGKVTFHILNFVKNYSIFQNGMKICYATKSNGYKWVRGCTDIKYRQTNIPVNTKRSEKCYYALSFSYNYQSAEDVVYFAYCYPYTYTMLQQFLFHRSETSSFLKRRNIAITPGGNSVDLLTISNFKQKEQKKRIVFITSRVHPGETPSSFICQGMMRFLLGNSEEAKTLRDNFVFKFVPMLNPDGVINGSYRCSLSGYDLNRVWHRADKISHPEIYGARKAVYDTNSYDKIFLFADLHAHSKKKGVFAYGCQNKNNPYLCRQMPFLFWKNVPDFNYYQCNFMMHTGRQGTSRLYNYRELQIDYSYTIEHSFCGPAKERVHYTPKSYMKIGVDYLLTFHKYFCKVKKVQSSTFNDFQIFQELYVNKQLIKIGQAEQCSSSDQQLDKQKAPLPNPESKVDKKIQKRQSFRFSEYSLKNPKRTVTNFRKTNLQLLQNRSKEFIIPKVKQIPNFGETMRPLPIVDPNFREKKQDKIEETTPYISFRPRVSSSLTSSIKPQSVQKRFTIRQTFRYDQQQDVSSLTNLFLPSLTRASYKKYNRKSSSPKNLVQIGNPLIQNAIILKQQIRSISKKRQGWKQQARSYL